MVKIPALTKKKRFPSSLQDAEMIISAIVFGLASLFLFMYVMSGEPGTSVRCIKSETINIGGRFTPFSQQHCILSLEDASSEQARATGLSGRGAMPLDRGMLFIFDTPGSKCMWMKDMNFPLDIAWLDSQGKVLKVVENIKPDTYPQEYCAEGTLFVIEVNAGVAKPSGIVPGAQFNL